MIQFFQGDSFNSGRIEVKNSADIILTNNKLSGIVDAFSWSRHINEIIVKFYRLQLTFNLVACVSAFAAALLIFKVPIQVSEELFLGS
jgi:magnesium-transporting ATPase (P-type)